MSVNKEFVFQFDGPYNVLPSGGSNRSVIKVSRSSQKNDKIMVPQEKN